MVDPSSSRRSVPGDFGDRVFAPEWVTVVVPPSPMYLVDVHERACADLELALVSLLAGSPLGSSARPIVAANRAKNGLAVGDGDKSPLGVADVVVRDLLELNLAPDLEVQLVQRICAKRARLIERPRPNTFASPTDLPAKPPTQKVRRCSMVVVPGRVASGLVQWAAWLVKLMGLATVFNPSES